MTEGKQLKRPHLDTVHRHKLRRLTRERWDTAGLAYSLELPHSSIKCPAHFQAHLFGVPNLEGNVVPAPDIGQTGKDVRQQHAYA